MWWLWPNPSIGNCKAREGLSSYASLELRVADLSLKMRLIRNIMIFTFSRCLHSKGNKELGLTHREFELLYHQSMSVKMTREHLLETVGLWLLWWCSTGGRFVVCAVTRTQPDVQNISDPPWCRILYEKQWFDQLKQFVMSSNSCLCSDYGWVYHCGSLAFARKP